MNVKTVSVTYGRKVNLGDFNSAAIECSLWADLGEGDNEAAVMGDLWAMAKDNVRAQILPLVKKQTAQVEEIFLGLPSKFQAELAENGNKEE